MLIAGERVTQQRLAAQWDSAALQHLLQQAREQYGNAICCCRPRPLKLQIRVRAGKSHLAVWPEQGPEHDSQCMYFRDEVAELACTGGAAAALAAATPASSGTLDTAEGEGGAPPPRLRVAFARREEGGAVDDELVLSVRGFTYRLWQEASLCRWHPAWQRDYGRMRYELLKAAAGYEFSGRPAERCIFVPRAFRERIQSELNREWEGFVRDVSVNKDGAPRLLIGQVRSFLPQSEGQSARVFLRHLHQPIGLHAGCYEFLRRECRNLLSNSVLSDRAKEEQPNVVRRPELVGAFSVEVSSRGGVWAKAGWLLGVHPTTFIPAANRHAVALIDALLAGRHSFQHLLSDLQPSQRWACDWLVRHVLDPTGKPVARAGLEILNPGNERAYIALRNEIATRMQQRGIPTWTWVPPNHHAMDVPALPPIDQTAPEAAQEALRQIARSPHAEYRYGPLTKLFVQRKEAA